MGCTIGRGGVKQITNCTNAFIVTPITASLINSDVKRFESKSHLNSVLLFVH